jgi:hypothetical protein
VARAKYEESNPQSWFGIGKKVKGPKTKANISVWERESTENSEKRLLVRWDGDTNNRWLTASCE